MNKRIRELLNEATSGLEPDISPQRTVTLNEMEKFAELIVRECMFQIKEEHNLNSNGTEPVGPYAHGFDDGMCVAIKTIKQHFGVEE